MRIILIFIFLYFTIIPFSFAQNIVNQQQAEQRFLKNNLALLAAQFNISAAQAQVIQARLWQNPFFSAELNALNPEGSRAFDVGQSGQKVFAIDQLIYLGGKKKNEINFAKSNVELAELLFTDLLRNLKFQLRASFYNIHYDRNSIKTLDNQLSLLDTLIQAYTVQAQKGNVPLKDLVRLQSLYLNLKNERNDLVSNALEEQKQIQLLLGTSETITTSPEDSELAVYQKNISFTANVLLDSALQNRPDLRFAQKSRQSAELLLKWQKSLAVPDLNLGLAYDQRGGAFNNQVNLTVGIPIPLLNRNQGNIQLAKVQLEQSKTLQNQQEIQIQNEVTTALAQYQEAKANFAQINRFFSENFEQVYKGMVDNFQKGNITMIEFTDFMESYQQNLLQLNKTQRILTNACEQLNWVTHSTIF
jgi:cobalt-zinc-cadmium efflux system outer membrane protein